MVLPDLLYLTFLTVTGVLRPWRSPQSTGTRSRLHSRRTTGVVIRYFSSGSLDTGALGAVERSPPLHQSRFPSRGGTIPVAGRDRNYRAALIRKNTPCSRLKYNGRTSYVGNDSSHGGSTPTRGCNPECGLREGAAGPTVRRRAASALPPRFSISVR